MSLSQHLKMTLLTIGQVDPETTANDAVLRLERGTQRQLACDLTSASKTLTADEFTTYFYFDCTGHTVARDLVVPLTVDGIPNPINRFFLVNNQGTSSGVLTVKGATGTTVAMAIGTIALLYCDGTDVTEILTGPAAATLLDLSDTPSSFSATGGFQLQVNAGATAVEFIAKPLDIMGFFGGVPGNAALIARIVAVRAFSLPSGLTGSAGVLGVVPTAAQTFDIKKNGGASLGTINFALGASTATFTFTSGTSWAAGDTLEIYNQATADATSADLSFSLLGTRT